MNRKSVRKTFVIAIITLLLALLLAPLALAAQDNMRSIQAPGVPPHTVTFGTSVLPAGISITINGTRTNPGGNTPLPFSITFTSPGPSNNLTTQPDSPVTYDGFPTLVSSGGVDYTLVSVSHPSPFTSGASGVTTPVVATYAECQLPAITTHPASQTVTYGSPVNFSVLASGTAPLSYQWYKDSTLLTGATLSNYSIASATMADAGSYHVEVSNVCGSTLSNAATLTVNKADQTITFAQPASPAEFGSLFSVNPTASSGLPVTLVASGACSNTLFNVTMTSGVGVCTLTASQAGNDNYNPATDVVRTVDASKASQTITFAQPASPAVYGSLFSVNPTASSGLPVTLVASGACSNLVFNVTMTSGVGVCTLTASQAGNDNYNPATDVVRTVAASKASQTITFAQPASPWPFLGTFDISPTATSGLPVTVVATGACTLSGSTVTMVLPFGSCTLTASQPGNDNYSPALDVVRIVDLPYALGLYMPLVFRQP